MELFDTVPLRLLVAVAVVLVKLKALSNVPVDPLFSAAERASAVASPVLLRVCVLLSVRECVLLSVNESECVLLSVLVLVSAPCPDGPAVWSANTAPLNPKASAMAEATSVFFMNPPKKVEQAWY
jgi:hypothetical protein